MNPFVIRASLVILAFAFGQLEYTEAAAGEILPPKAYVIVNNKEFPTTINGFQWSIMRGNLGQTEIADAAFDPAKGLSPIAAKAGSRVQLSFVKKPTTTRLFMWKQGKQIWQQRLYNTAFSLPKTAGDYTYEILGQWSKDYVQYDFEVRVH